jgi:hypothetical protein
MPIWEPSKDQLKAMWEAGDPLDTAWAEFKVLFDPIAQLPLSSHPTKGITFGLDDQRSRKPKTTRRGDRTHKLDAIYAGRLWAIGHLVLRGGSHELVRIPGEYFRDADIRWGKGELKVSGTSYFDIRIFRAPIRGDELLTAGSRGKFGLPKRKLANRKRDEVKPGRPNTARDIAETAQRLWNTRLKFRILALKGMVPAVRAAILGTSYRYQEIAGYKSSSMEKTISRALRALRKPNKPNKRNKRTTR